MEDEEYLARVLQDNLKLSGYATTVANDGKKALDHLAHATPDIIILDLLMPKHDGFYVLEHVKKNNAWKDIPVFVLSNLGEAHDIKRAMELGAADYFIKSHNTIMDVVTRVTQLLEKKKS